MLRPEGVPLMETGPEFGDWRLSWERMVWQRSALTHRSSLLNVSIVRKRVELLSWWLQRPFYNSNWYPDSPTDPTCGSEISCIDMIARNGTRPSPAAPCLVKWTGQRSVNTGSSQRRLRKMGSWTELPNIGCSHGEIATNAQAAGVGDITF